MADVNTGGINVTIGIMGMALQDDELTVAKKPTLAHGLTGGSPFAFERVLNAVAVACGIRSDVTAEVSEMNVNPSISLLAFQDALPLYLYAAYGNIDSQKVDEGLYKHVITIGDGLPSLTLWGQEGAASEWNFDRIERAKVNELELSFSDGGVLQATTSFMACNIVRELENPNAHLRPSCFDGYFTCTGGKFLVGPASQTPGEMVVTGATITTSNNCEAKRDASSPLPARIREGKNTTSVSIDTVPDSFQPWWEWVTGKKDGTEPTDKIVYGSYEFTFVHTENPDWKIVIEGHKVAFTAEAPEVDPEGNSGTITFSSDASYVKKVGDSPVVITVYNDIPDYLDPKSYELPRIYAEPAENTFYGGIDTSDLGDYVISNHSKTIIGSAKRYVPESSARSAAIKEGYNLPIIAEDSQGAKVYAAPATLKDQAVSFDEDGIAVVWLGYDDIEAETVTVVNPDETETVYVLDVEPEESEPSVTAKILTEGSFKDVTYKDAGTFQVSNRSRRITGTAIKRTAKEFSNGNVSGYFLPIHFDGAKQIKTAKHPEGKAPDESGDFLVLLGEQSPTLSWIEAVDANGEATRFTVEIAASSDMINAIDVAKWGFVKTKDELNTVVGQGESEYIDHDNNIFYWVLKEKIGEEYKKFATIITCDGVEYAGTAGGNYQYHYSGLGAGSGHATDYDWKREGSGCPWEKNTSSVDVSGKTVTLEVRKYGEDLSEENAQSVLATGGNVVFGPQEIDCKSTESFTAPAVIALSNPVKVAAPKTTRKKVAASK